MLYFCSRGRKRSSVYYIVFFGIFCVLCYQIYVWRIVSNYLSSRPETTSDDLLAARLIARGISQDHLAKYKSDEDGKFVCLDTKKKIEYNHINDDYCDCVSDGVDEPRTSACSKGTFFCETKNRLNPDSLPSGRVNDGICDCCDGSDEWAQIFPYPRLSENIQSELKLYQSPCPNLCPEDV